MGGSGLRCEQQPGCPGLWHVSSLWWGGFGFHGSNGAISPTLPLWDLYSINAWELYFPPRLSFFCCTVLSCSSRSAFFWHWFGEWGGAMGMLCKHHSCLPLPLNTAPQKIQCSLSPTDSSSLRSPFSLPVSSDQLTHAWLSITEQSCVQVPGARTKLERCLQRKCQYRNTRLFTKPLFILWQRCMYL